ncbi:hypothetical protein AVEN_2871-1 [Araneus ventricosus]|uniref:Uncharacterized protein n=1 Tax=Araneus ventricosus TaxID=182803 RepID=A0A4Y2RSZ9_ARAVE|nr:hypothetical protein AVEN_2871-1 [Araneus ventricosus]
MPCAKDLSILLIIAKEQAFKQICDNRTRLPHCPTTPEKALRQAPKLNVHWSEKVNYFTKTPEKVPEALEKITNLFLGILRGWGGQHPVKMSACRTTQKKMANKLNSEENRNTLEKLEEI